jgi:arginine decarboxylase
MTPPGQDLEQLPTGASTADSDVASASAAWSPDWSPEAAEDLYQMSLWSDGFFSVNDQGHVCVRPLEDQELAIDIADVIRDVIGRGTSLPVLIRFQDVLRARVRRLNAAFATAIEESGYQNVYRGVYPIKVNQLHEVVDEVLEAGRTLGIGLECGSKAELIATLPQLADDSMLLICNGVKDETMLRLMLGAQRLGKNVIPVVEKYTEFEQLMKLGDEMDIVPRFGTRVRLATSGAGRWAESGGYRSKFGISIPELLDLVGQLEARGARRSLALLHFHVGSQIPDIQILKQATKEITQVYARLCMRGLEVDYIDVGGGLGVVYGDAAGTSEGGINYGLAEYAAGVVYSVKEVCDAHQVPHPVLVSESGRAITAHHSVLVIETLGAFQRDFLPADFEAPGDVHAVVRGLLATRRELAAPGHREMAELIEACHDNEEGRRESNMLFALGYLSLEDQALADRLYWTNSAIILDGLRRLDPDPAPPEMVELEESLVDRYLCDFSVFQSMLDHWAIGQKFPVVPIDRLNERPSKRAIIVDLTCDSDGKIHSYVSANDDTSYLELHPMRTGEPYHLGIFLMGAYQDIMGDAHNLFGRVPEVHIYADADEPNNYWVETILPGTSVEEMLAQVQYFRNDLHRRMNEMVRDKIGGGVVRPKVGMDFVSEYMACFSQVTYYDPRHREGPA